MTFLLLHSPSVRLIIITYNITNLASVSTASGVSVQFIMYLSLTSILQTQPTTAIADSFPGMEAMQPVAPQRQAAAPVQLKNPPKWLKRPVGANFGFGGKLVTFQAVKAPANQQVGMVV